MNARLNTTVIIAMAVIVSAVGVSVHLVLKFRPEQELQAAPETPPTLLKTTSSAPLLDEWLSAVGLPRTTAYTCWQSPGDMDAIECTVHTIDGLEDVHCLKAEGRCWLARHP